MITRRHKEIDTWFQYGKLISALNVSLSILYCSGFLKIESKLLVSFNWKPSYSFGLFE